MHPKPLVVVALAALSFASGAAGQYFYPGQDVSPVDLWVLPGFAFLIFWWYRLDSSQAGYKRTPWLNVGVIAVAALALPYYFFRSRGLKRGSLATLAMLGAIVASGLLTLGGQYTASIGLQG